MRGDDKNNLEWACPLPITHNDKIVMGHGSGGRMTHDLVKNVFWKYLLIPSNAIGNDAAVLDAMKGDAHKKHFVVSTDSHVVSPLFFPGGDIGRLAVCGTVNDISMMGAKPLWLTAGFILEEGFEIDSLAKILSSMQIAAEEAGIDIVAGDTKVVQKGKGDGIYINTSGFGIISSEIKISGENAKPGDQVILSGPIGDHGIAVLMARGDLGLEANIQSDVAPLNHLVHSLLSVCKDIHVLRDPTRGGLATTLNEIALQSKVCIFLDEKAILVNQPVSSACELLGFDPLYIANEGKLIAIVAPGEASIALSTMRKMRIGAQAQIIGEVESTPAGKVLLKTEIGTTRIVDMLAGEMLPRIC